VATSREGLIQQVAVSYLRHGYWWYVTGTIPDRKAPESVDKNILTKYDIRKDWRVIAERKARGQANLQYIRHGRFFLIMATQGFHEFKEREAKRIRDARKCPILVPLANSPAKVFEGYAVSFRRGGYVRKSADERLAYRAAVERWKEARQLGHDIARPERGERDAKWHSVVEIEGRTFHRLRTSFNEIAVHRSRVSLEYELHQTPFVPWQPVKQQFVRIIKDINETRRRAGFRDQIPYHTVLKLKRQPLSPFTQSEQLEADQTAA
jgi:hypothetical protein